MHRFATLVGWDIGGAHLKVARIDNGHLHSVVEKPCPLWKGLEHLAGVSNEILAGLPAGPVVHAVTMTGEMADIFPDRRTGVRQIVACLAECVRARPQDALHFYAGGQTFVDAEASSTHTDTIASANWMATAAYCAAIQGDGILIDIGSTTTDIIPFANGAPCALGTTDASRLTNGELVYAGVVRTPLMGLAARAPLSGSWHATTNEYFASSADIFRITGELDENTDLYPAADGGGKTVEGSARRLLRMLGSDFSPTTAVQVAGLARWYRERLLQRIGDAMTQMTSRGHVPHHAPIIGAGIGRFLLPDLAARWHWRWRDCAEVLCPESPDANLRTWAGYCAPAVAVARLAGVFVR